MAAGSVRYLYKLKMHSSTLHNWQYSHSFKVENEQGERRTWLVTITTVAMMVVEIGAGIFWAPWRCSQMAGM